MGIRELQHEETEARQQDRGSWRLDIRGAEGLVLSEETLMKSGEGGPPLGATGLSYCTCNLHGREQDQYLTSTQNHS